MARYAKQYLQCNNCGLRHPHTAAADAACEGWRRAAGSGAEHAVVKGYWEALLTYSSH